MGRYAIKVCHECGIRRPINLMTSQIEKVKSGNIGFGLSFNPSRKKSFRVQLPRNKYSRRTVYYCKDKAAHNVLDYYGMSQKKLTNSTTQQKVIIPPQRDRQPVELRGSTKDKTRADENDRISDLESLIPLEGSMDGVVNYFNKKYRVNIDGQNYHLRANIDDTTSEPKKTDKETDEDPRQKYLDLYYAEDFFDKCCIILGFKIANADGNIQEIEFTNFVKNYTENKSVSRDDIHEIWEMANNYSDKNIISLLNKKYNANIDASEDIIVNLLFIAEADGEIVSEEYNKIKDYALKLGLTSEQFDNLYKRFEPSEITNDQTMYDIDDIDEIADLIDIDDE
jgi:uncharacterized tellurite resistance protein B-like protein